MRQLLQGPALVGVVASAQKAQQFVATARSVNGVVSVKSFLQIT